MKKYITVAALLAAGTAFSNAATSLEDAFYSKVLNLSEDTYTVSGGTSTSFSYTFTLKPSFITDGMGETGAKNTEMTPTLVSVTAGNVSGNGIYVGTAAGYSTTNGLITAKGVFATATEASSTSTPATYYGGSNEFSATTANGLYAAEDVDFVAVTVAHTAGTSTTVYTTLYLNDGSYVNFDGTANTSMKWGSGMTAPSELSINTAAGISSVYIFNSVLTADEAHTINQAAISAVPEPSAFGLLAGIGALALVASRRRRK